jgi:phosphatidylcholine synthase
MPYSFLKLRGWTIHAITASGALVTLYGFYAVAQQQIRLALLLMLLTIVIDAVDGPLARFWKVKHVVPNFDGARLDYIVDFSSWVVLPAFFLLCNDILMPEPWSTIASALIVISSCYQFCCTDLKSTSSNFKRFPSAWSLIIILFVMWQFSPVVSFSLILLGVICSFVPTYYSHPFQRNEFHNKTFNIIGNALLVILGILLLASIFVQVVYFPTYLSLISWFQQVIVIIYFLYCAYGTYKNWS